MTLLLIANPACGGGRGEKYIPQIERTLEDLKLEFKLVKTSRPKEAIELARKAVAEGFQKIVAVGGDGTVHEVVNGILGTGAILGIIPIGDGNDISRCLHIPRDIPAACRLLEKVYTRTIDVGTANGTYFVGVASTGFDSVVTEIANEMTIKVRGPVKYTLAAFRALTSFRASNFYFNCDGKLSAERAMLIAVANTRNYGGGMKVAPAAELDDGLFDICLVREISRFHFIRVFPTVFSGQHIKDPNITIFRAREIEISSEKPFHVYADGEYIMPLPARFRIVPRALEVIVPSPATK